MIKVHFYAFQEKYLDSLKLSLKNRAPDTFTFVAFSSADVIVYDADKDINLSSLERSGAQLIAVSRNPYLKHKAELLLPKPLMFTQLVEAVKSLANTDKKKTNIPDAKAVSIRSYKADDYFLGLVQKNLQDEEGYFFYSWSPEHWVVLDVANKSAFLGGTKKILSQIVFRKLSDQYIRKRTLDYDEFDFMASCADHKLTLEHFLWLVANFTSRGRLVSSVDPSMAFHLKFFPDLTRYSSGDDENIALSCFFLAGDYTINEAVSLLDISSEKVVNFISCCAVCDFLENKGIGNKNNTTINSDNKLSKFLELILNKMKQDG